MKSIKIKPLNTIINWLGFNRRNKKNVKNIVFEMPHNQDRVNSIKIPNIQNKTFKVSKWFVKVGEIVNENQIICELESNSITLEFESTNKGKLVKITNSTSKLKADDEICLIENI